MILNIGFGAIVVRLLVLLEYNKIANMELGGEGPLLREGKTRLCGKKVRKKVLDIIGFYMRDKKHFFAVWVA